MITKFTLTAALVAASMLTACGGGDDDVPDECVTTTSGVGARLTTTQVCSTPIDGVTKRVCSYYRDFKGVTLIEPVCSVAYL